LCVIGKLLPHFICSFIADTCACIITLQSSNVSKPFAPWMPISFGKSKYGQSVFAKGEMFLNVL
jgi:hypothetical protein